MYEKWILGLAPADLKSFAQSSDWVSRLLIFELNHIYAVYYGHEPDLHTDLPKELYELIKSKYPHYYEKILEIEERLDHKH